MTALISHTHRVFAMLIAAAAMLAAAVPISAASKSTASELDIIKQRFVASVLLPKGPQRDALAALVSKERVKLGPDGAWSDIPYSAKQNSAWTASGHLARLLPMAIAYRTPGQPLYGDKSLRTQTLAALDYWLAHDYQNPNWWWNQIGVPQYISEIMVLMEPDLSADEMAKGNTILMRSVPRGTGANLVWLAENTILRGCLENDPKVVKDAYDQIYAELKIAPLDSEGGITPDWSLHQHGPQLYSGGYGLSFGNDAARFASYAWGTQFQIPADKLQILESYLLDGQQWMVRGKFFDYSAIGREITRVDEFAVPTSWLLGPINPTGAAYGMLNAVKLLGQCDGISRASELSRFAKRMAGDKNVPLVGNRSYWCSDYMAHQRAGYMASVRMCSTRIRNSEIVNDEGKRSQNLGYGMMYIYQRGDEYENIFPVWDWQRIPGTTTEQLANPFADRAAIGVFGKTSFVGNVSDGVDGAACFDLDKGALTGHKAWFFFDSGVACLGAGLTCATDNKVLTSVAQCLLNGPVQQGNDSSGQPWVWHDGIGYDFPDGGNIQVRHEAQSGRWSDIGTGSPDVVTKDVFSVWLDHGSHLDNAQYAYLCLPGVKADQIAARAKNLSIIVNTPSQQAVADLAAKRVSCAFWSAGTIDGGKLGKITVDVPCLLLVQHLADGKVRVTASNPENKPLEVHATFTLPGKSARSGTISLPAGPDAGKSVGVEI